MRRATVTTSWFLYPGACVQRALGTWSARSTPIADSLQPTTGFPNSSGYTDNQPDIAGNNNTIAYTRLDASLSEKLWHVVDASVTASQRPTIIDGSRSLWCGKFDANWVYKVGYPNMSFQILYLDTGAHSGTFHLTFTGNISSEQNYDYNCIIGGGGGNLDPLQNRRDLLSDMLPPAGVVTSGPSGDSDNIIAFTGNIQTPQTLTQNHLSTLAVVVGAGSGQPSTVSFDITIDADHRAIYWVFTSDCIGSTEDGLWPGGKGQVIDLLATSDNGSLYNDQTQAGGLDPYSGDIIKGTYGTAGFISARVPAGLGDLWQLAPGNENVTSDICAPQKVFSTDLFFEGGDPISNVALNGQANSLVSCTFPIPPGTASVIASWGQYSDLPRFAGFVQLTEYRYFKGGGWTRWRNASSAEEVNTGASQTWSVRSSLLAEAAPADSVQLRWSLRCIPSFAADRANCSTTLSNPLLYDDLSLQVISGTNAPAFGIFPGAVAQTTFVDGTIVGDNCSGAPCWPGIRGTGLGTAASHNIAIHDNWNSPTGDSITVAIVTGLRGNGMGVNWKDGLDKTMDAGENYQARHNGAFNAAYDFPRMIYRLFDPSTKTWSAFDSCQIYPNVAVAGTDTAVIGSEYAINWPPDDKVFAGASLPGGFTINGTGSYASLAFLPKGTRMQYYFKGVDINGGVAYTFGSDNLAREVEDLPTLPGGSIKAPDIIEWRVLPGVYPAGPGGSLLAGKTDADVLNLDAVYSAWSYGFDPVTQALRGLGVRADRYRHLTSGVTDHGIGGHEFPGARPNRLSNYFPNYLEYAIVDSLAAWYRIMVESSHARRSDFTDEQDATLVEQWWRKETGSNGGDRCVFASGDEFFNITLNTAGVVSTNQTSLAQNVFGVASAVDAWSGTVSTPYPTIDDRFAASSAGPALAAASTFTYPVDGGCPGPKKFDALTKVGVADAVSAVFYPNAQVAGIARMRELDGVADKDRGKALGYGFSIQYIRQGGYSETQANYVHSGIENRMRVLYKFLTSCRGARTGAPADTGKCWPCPSPGTTLGLMQADWATQSSGFQTGTWGPLYPIQAGALTTAVEEPTSPPAPYTNALLQNRPNPFNPETTIPYSLAASGRVVIRLFDIAGRNIRTLVDRTEAAGPHIVRWNGKTDNGQRAASGVYFYRITYPSGEVSAKKMMIVR